MNMRMGEGKPLKSHEWVMNDIKNQIVEGKLAAGVRLASVVDLATQYGVGRSTIREALSALKAMGMLNIKQGGGTFVLAAPTSHPGQVYLEGWNERATTLRHILDVRRLLETGCAALAAKQHNELDLIALQEILQGMEQNLDDERYNEQADVRFHQLIAAATHNPILIELMESLSHKLHDSMKDTRALWFYAERSTAQRLLSEHHAIYEAIASQDAAEASARMELHITKVEQVLGEKGAWD